MGIFDSLLRWLGLAAPAAPVKSASTAAAPDDGEDAAGLRDDEFAETAEAADDGFGDVAEEDAEDFDESFTEEDDETTW